VEWTFPPAYSLMVSKNTNLPYYFIRNIQLRTKLAQADSPSSYSRWGEPASQPGHQLSMPLTTIHTVHTNYSPPMPPFVGRVSSVAVATCCGLDGPGIETWEGARFSAPVQTNSGAYPASYTMGTGSFPGVKWPGYGVEYPPHLAPMLKKM